jgi:hypothetical protein
VPSEWTMATNRQCRGGVNVIKAGELDPLFTTFRNGLIS